MNLLGVKIVPFWANLTCMLTTVVCAGLG